ncbi:MAG: UDP-N-acetylmuramoyl-tripeptide--D-alanyl-D-alanine ligase [Tidjanibacter sp.]|nr:UDP-N-acetylmuramoyl-tripeptide--D-alanyl-D-alanine ligase [Tidjanibacter sp.]
MKKLYDIFCASTGVVTDSRKVREGELFFALRGENFDGNQYAAKALEMGAVAAVVDRADVAHDERYVVVDDTLSALQDLARYHRQRLSIPVVAITGTNGKTTTKELVAAVLSESYRTYFTQGNLNNHIGVPLTLLSIPRDAQMAIVEMGASAQGEIALLCSIAQPTYGLVTNVGRAHLEGFGGEEGVRKGKGELYDYLARTGGLALYRADDTTLSAMVAEREGLRTKCYSSSLADGVESNLVGDYNHFNIAAALAVAELFGVGREVAERAIGNYIPTNNRSQMLTTERALLTVDCYNANPSSMAVAIANHASTNHADYPAKILILGDMLELGEWSLREHQRVLDSALESDAQRVLVVGSCFGEVAATINSNRLVSFASADQLAQWLREQPLERAFVLVKGSRGVGLERVLGAL